MDFNKSKPGPQFRFDPSKIENKKHAMRACVGQHQIYRYVSNHKHKHNEHKCYRLFGEKISHKQMCKIHVASN